MADDSHGRHHTGVSKLLKGRWRSRSNATEEPQGNVQTDQDIDDFLKPSASATNSQATRPQRPTIPQAPKIDIAAVKQWSAASQGNAIPSTPSSLKANNLTKQPRRPGLSVNWSESPPEVIGEGGEECEYPTKEISIRKQHGRSSSGSGLSRSATHKPSTSISQRVYESPPRLQRSLTIESSPPPVQPPPPGPPPLDGRSAAYQQLFGEKQPPPPPPPVQFKSHPGGPDDVIAKPLKRSATGRVSSGNSESNFFPSKERAVTKSPDRFRSGPASSAPDDSPTDPYAPKMFRKDSQPEQLNRIQRMRQEEARVLHQNARRSIFELAEEDMSRLKISDENHMEENEPLPSPPPLPPGNQSVEPSLPQIGPPPSLPTVYASNIKQNTSLAQRNNNVEKAPMVASKLNTKPSPVPLQPQIQNQSQTQIQPFPQAQSQTQSQTQAPPPPPKAPVPPPHSSTSTSSSFKAFAPPGGDSKPLSSPVSSTTYSPVSNTYKSASAAYQSAYSSYNPTAKAAPVRNNYSKALPTSPNSSMPPPQVPKSIPAPYQRSESRQSDVSNSPEQLKSKFGSVRSAGQTSSTSTSQASFEDFGKRCEHMKGIFKLQGEFEKPIQDYTPTQWLRCASWWFIKGRAEMEIVIRGRPRTPDGASQRSPEQLLQPHVDLAKTWWILSEVIPHHRALPPSSEASFSSKSSSALNNNDHVLAEFFDSCELLHMTLKGLLGSLTRNNAMPPYNALIQGQDQTMWVQYPRLTPEILPMLSGTKTSLTGSTNIRTFDPLSILAIIDTKRDFAYYRWPTEVTIQVDENDSDRIQLACVFSVMRPRNDWHLKIGICTQKELVSICVTGDRKFGPSWEDVKWSETDFSLQIKLPQGYIMNAQLQKDDFFTLANMYKKGYAVQTSLSPLDNEEVIFEVPIEDFQFSDTLRPPAFPPEIMRRCRIRVFGKSEIRNEATGSRKFYRGIRLLVVTSPKNRVLAFTEHDLGIGKPTVIELLTEPKNGENFPAMLLHVQEERRDATLYMVFGKVEERDTLYNAFHQAPVAAEEMQYAALRLKKMTIDPTIQTEDWEQVGHSPLGKIQWLDLTIINKDPYDPNDDFGQVVGSESLRIVSNGMGGTVTDRLNAGPGELRFKLSSDGTPNIEVLRMPQDDLSITIDRRVVPFNPDSIIALQNAVVNSQTTHSYSFFNLDDLHKFVFGITGFTTKYDGLARDFVIARRRPVPALSKHKKLESGLTRIVIVSHDNDKVVQFIAFFEDNNTWAESFGFVMKSVDVFERFESKGKIGVRLVDAKFTLTRPEKSSKALHFEPEEIAKGYINLDMPEVPIENDDIWIGFDDYDERETFLKALPAPVSNGPTSLSSLWGRKS